MSSIQTRSIIIAAAFTALLTSTEASAKKDWTSPVAALERSKEVQGGCDWWKVAWSGEEFASNRRDVEISGSNIKLAGTTYDLRGKDNRVAFKTMLAKCSGSTRSKSVKAFEAWRMAKSFAGWGWIYPLPPILLGAMGVSMLPGTRQTLEGAIKAFAGATDKTAERERTAVKRNKKSCERVLAGSSSDVPAMRTGLKSCETYAKTRVGGSRPWLNMFADDVNQKKTVDIPKLKRDIFVAEVKGFDATCKRDKAEGDAANFKAATRACRSLLAVHKNRAAEIKDLPVGSLPETEARLNSLLQGADAEVFRMVKSKDIHEASALAGALHADLNAAKVKATSSASKSSCRTLDSTWGQFSKLKIKGMDSSEYKLFSPIVSYMGRDEVCGTKAVEKTRKGVQDMVTLITMVKDAKQKVARDAQRRALARNYSCRGWDNSRSYLELESDGSYMLKFTDGWVMGRWSVSRNTVSLSFDKTSVYLQQNQGGSIQYQIQGRSLILESRIGTTVCR